MAQAPGLWLQSEDPSLELPYPSPCGSFLSSQQVAGLHLVMPPPATAGRLSPPSATPWGFPGSLPSQGRDCPAHPPNPLSECLEASAGAHAAHTGSPG